MPPGTDEPTECMTLGCNGEPYRYCVWFTENIKGVQKRHNALLCRKCHPILRAVIDEEVDNAPLTG